MDSAELIALCLALPVSVERIRFHDPGSGEIEIEFDRRPAAPAVSVSTPGPETAAQLQVAFEARKAAERPSDVDSVTRTPPEFPGDE